MVSPDGNAQLKWPPPGLERMQGDLLVIASRGALAGGMLALPLLYAVSKADSGFATLGPFADAWWFAILLATVGLAFGLDTLIRAARTQHRAARALRSGYDLRTVARVLADGQRDMGFLLTGGRHFSVLERGEREGIAAIRVTVAMMLVVAGLWLLGGVGLGIAAAASGAITPEALLRAALAPPALVYVLSGVAALAQDARVRRARRLWHRQPWSEDLVSEEIRVWRESADVEPPAGASTTARSGLRIGTVAAMVLALLLALPVLTLLPASAIAPVLTSVSMPSYDSYRVRAARSEAFRSYGVDGDVTITAEEAGRLLHDLMFVGSEVEPSPGERPPFRRYARPWLPEGDDADNPIGLAPFTWADSLVARVATVGLDADERAYLRGLADHPASADFARLARATSLDVGSARWVSPFPAGMTTATVPVPRFRSIRDAAKVHVGAAALALAERRTADGERILREVVSVGLLLGDDGPTLIDNVVGYTLVEDAGGALLDFYRAAGRPGDAATLSRIVSVADRAAQLVQTRYAGSPESFVRSLPEMVLDTTLMRGLRWEFFVSLTTMAPCLNLNRIVFGADDEYGAFLEEAHDALVRWPSEEGIFELARHGWIGGAEAAEPGVFGRVAALYMSSDEHSCARFVRHMGSAGMIF